MDSEEEQFYNESESECDEQNDDQASADADPSSSPGSDHEPAEEVNVDNECQEADASETEEAKEQEIAQQESHVRHPVAGPAPTMMNSIPKETLDALKCSSCRKYLSIFPVFFTQDKKSICGRCSTSYADEELNRNEIYERSSSLLQFPCTYMDAGCLEYYYPEEMCTHEAEFHEIPCPSRNVSSCKWKGSHDGMLAHCLKVHSVLVLDDGMFEVDLLGTHARENILTLDDKVFAFKRQFSADTNVLRCWVEFMNRDEHSKSYSYEIIIRDSKENCSVKFPQKHVGHSVEQFTEINIDDVQKVLQDPPIIVGQVKIVPNVDGQLNIKAISEFECPICFHYMTNSIYLCDTGHSLCKDCKKNVKSCSICQAVVTNRRNFTSEKMANNFQFPCQNPGCTYISVPNELRKHDKFCIYKIHRCPILEYEFCEWSGNRSHICGHVIESHHKFWFDKETVAVLIDDKYWSKTDTKCYIRKFTDKIFKLRYKYDGANFCWNMQLIGPPEESSNYVFEIQIQDGKNEQKMLYAKWQCSPLTYKHSWVWFPEEQVKPLIMDVLTYKVQISSKK